MCISIRRVSCVAVVVCVGLAQSQALAQFDNSVWPGFSGQADKNRTVTAPGPASNPAFTRAGIGTPSYGGMTLAANGDIYYKDYRTNVGGAGGTFSGIVRLNAADGMILAQTPNLGGVAGDHGGVAVGVDAVYATIYRGAGNTSVIKLNKTTLATINEFTNAAWVGIRGTPLVGTVPNMNGHVNLYVVDRNGNQILAIDSVTGAQMGVYPFGGHVLSQLGPLWQQNGRDVFAYFNNSDLGNAVALSDDGNGTLTNLWPITAGPGNFNWWGSGALSTDGTKIYVTTFNDNNTDTLWALNVSDGSVVWSVPGNRGAPDERNYFGRPAVVGSDVYCGGGAGVITKFTDNGTGYSLRWERREGTPEYTCTSAVRTADGQTFVYSIAQDDGGLGRLIILRDDGDAFTLVLDTNLNGAMRWSIFASSSGLVDASGNLWIGGGRNDDATPGDIYKFTPMAVCHADFNHDMFVNSQDYFDFLTAFFANDPSADFNNDMFINSQDFFDFLTAFFNGCP